MVFAASPQQRALVHYAFGLIAAFPRICFVRHCEERSDVAISKQMLGMTTDAFKPKVYNSEKNNYSLLITLYSLIKKLSTLSSQLSTFYYLCPHYDE